MKVLVCDTCLRTIKQNEPFWKSYYSKRVFYCASCAAIANGCKRYEGGEEYDRIFVAKSIDDKAWENMRANLDSTHGQQLANQVRNDVSDYRFDLDF